MSSRIASAAGLVQKPLDGELRIEQPQVNPEQPVEPRKLHVFQGPSGLLLAGVFHRQGDLAQLLAAGPQSLEPFERLARKRPGDLQQGPLDGGQSLGPGRLGALGVDIPLELGVRPHEAQVGGLDRQHERQRHVCLPTQQGKTGRAKKRQQVPPVQEGRFEVLRQLHGQALWKRSPETLANSPPPPRR